MSTTIDSKVVEMKFDNRQFEREVQTSLNTIDKLNSSLQLKGATKGLEAVDAAAKKVDMNGLGASVDTVKVKFSAMEVMAVTAMTNIANSVYNAGKNMVKALTIEPVMSGFSEYETQINAIQTILANTESKGTTLDDVTSALDQLNAYADKTIYNFTEMTRNIGTFTAAGVDLDTSVNAIQGIANLAAVSGSTSQQASTAMYQLSQALSSGTVKLMDWNSVVNAGMGGQVFQDALKETARIHGIAIDDMIESEGSFRETLRHDWLSAEILTETLAKFTMTTEGLTDAQIKANREMLKAKGYTDAQIDSIFQMGKTATDAATKVKTFTQLFDTLKEAASSGWTQTWELIIGDFDQAKSLFTSISDTIGGIIGESAEARNSLLAGALGPQGINSNAWTKFAEETGVATEAFQQALIDTAREHGIAIDDMIAKEGSFTATLKSGWLTTDIITETLKKFTGEVNTSTMTLEELDAVARRVWRGEFDNGAARVKALTEAGYDYATVQGYVNHLILGTEYDLSKLSDTQLKSMGYTEDQVKALRELAKQAEKTGTPINELMKNLYKPSGRELLLDSLANIGTTLLNVFKAVRDAYRDIFAMDSGELYSIIEGFHTLTEMFKIGEGTAEKLKRTLKGVFAVVNIGVSTVKSIVGGLFKLLSIMTSVGGTGGNLLDFFLSFTASIGDFLVKVQDAYLSLDLVGKAFDALAGLVRPVAEYIRDFALGIKESLSGMSFEGFITSVKNAFVNLKNTLEQMSLEEFKEIGRNMIQGLINGVSEMISVVKNTIVAFGTKVIDFVKDIFDIHSPSRVFQEIGEFIVEGFIDGISSIVTMTKAVFDALGELLVHLFDTTGKVIDSVDFEGLFSRLFGVVKQILAGFVNALRTAIEDGTLSDVIGLIGDIIVTAFTAVAGFNFAGILKNIKDFTGGFAGIGDLMSGLTDGFSKFIDALSAEKRGKALESVAKSVLMLAGAVIVLSFVDVDRISKGLLALGGVMAEFAVFVKNAGLDQTLPKSGGLFISLALSMLILSGAISILGKMDMDTVAQGIIALGATLAVLSKSLSALPNTKGLTSTAFAIQVLGVGMIILAGAIALLGIIPMDKLAVGIIAMGAALKVIAKAMDQMPKDGMLSTSAALVVVAGALYLLSGVIAIMGNMSVGTLAKGILAMGAALYVLATALNQMPTDTTSIGFGLVIVSGAMIILAGAVGLMGAMPIATIAKGIIAMGVALAGLVIVLNSLPTDTAMLGIGLTIVAGAITTLALAVGLMGAMPVETLVKGVIAMGAALAVLVIALNLMKGTLAGSAALLVAAMALTLLVPALLSLGATALVAAAGILVIAGAFAVLGLAGFILGPLTPVILALAGAITLLGIGVLSAGTGVLLLASGLTILGLTGGAGVSILIEAFRGLIDLIPYFLGAVANGVVQFLLIVTVGVGQILAAITTWIPPLFALVETILIGLLQTIINVTPKLLETVMFLLMSVLQVLADNIYQITETALMIIVGFIDGIAAGLPAIIESAINLVISFIDGLAVGIEQNAERFLQAVWNLIMAMLKTIGSFVGKMAQKAGELISGFIKGIGDWIGKGVKAIGDFIMNLVKRIGQAYKDFKAAAGDLLLGFIEGIWDGFKGVIDAVGDFCESVGDAVCDFFGIASPSKLFRDYGKFLDDGMAGGIKDNADVAWDASKYLGEQTVYGLEEGLTDVENVEVPSLADILGESFNNEVDVNPTITPVLDLSEVEEEARTLDTMFSSDLASGVSATIASSKKLGNWESGELWDKAHTTVNYTQNNYSPKSLSRVEIYRQTKNQLAKLNS